MNCVLKNSVDSHSIFMKQEEKIQITGNRPWKNFVDFEEINCIKKVPRARYAAHNE